MRKSIFAVILAALGSLLTNHAAAQGTAFSYQGRLNTASGPANGSYDLTFTLFNTNAGGILISGPVTNSSVGVSNGLFTVAVDFGSAPFTAGQALWLEIGARTNGAATFSTLAPRQAVLSTPIADYALAVNSSNLLGQVTDANLATTFTSPHSFNNAADSFTGNGSGLTALNGSQITSGTVADARLSSNVALRNAVNNFTGGSNTFSSSVGIGTATPAKLLDVTGSAPGVPSGGSVDSSVLVRLDNSATDGTIPSSDVVGIGFGHNSTREAIVGASFGYDFLDFYVAGVLTSPAMRILGNGNVGIGTGTTNPATTLQVVGTVTATSFTGSFAGNGSGLTNVALLNQLNNFTGGSNIFAGRVGIGTSTPQIGLDVNSPVYAQPAAQFDVANCGVVCGQTDFQEAIRLWNQNGNGQVGLGFLVGANSFNSNAVPDVWIGTHYASSANDFKIATRTNSTATNLVDRVYVNGTSGNVGIGTDSPGSALQVNGTVTATSFAGNGSGLTNVALLNAANTFTAQQIFKVTPFDDGCVVTDGANSLGSYIGAGQCSFGTFTSHALGFFVNNGFDSMDLNTNGFLGIGTGTPANKLDVQGSADFTGNVGIGTITPTNTLQVIGTVAASALRAPGAGVNTGTFAFIQRAVGTNTAGDQTFIYNPVCDGDPNAILIVTHNWTADTNSTSQYNTKPVGVYYNGGNWAIFNEDTSAMALGRAFNVMVIKN